MGCDLALGGGLLMSCRMTLLIAAMVALGVMGADRTAQARSPFGELTIGVGPIFPQTTAAKYSDVGGSLYIRATPHLTAARAISFWGDLGGSIFSDESRKIYIPVIGGSPIPGTQETTESNAYLHVGAQLGSPSAKGFFRPRAGIGIGLYVFFTETQWKGKNQEEALAEDYTDSQGRWGWRGILGSDFFFSPKWGISADFIYDQVWRLNQQEVKRGQAQTARFHTYALGVVIPFDSAE
jgi:hypothetical protein